MNRFKLFDGSEFEGYGFIIQLKDHPFEGATYWWIHDLHSADDIPDDYIGWGDDGGNDVGEFIGYLTFKEFHNVE